MAWLFFLEHYVWLSCGYCNVICKIDTEIENEFNDLFRNILSSLMFHQHRHLQLRRRIMLPTNITLLIFLYINFYRFWIFSKRQYSAELSSLIFFFYFNFFYSFCTLVWIFKAHWLSLKLTFWLFPFLCWSILKEIRNWTVLMRTEIEKVVPSSSSFEWNF